MTTSDFPHPALIAQMAREFFTALPTAQQPVPVSGPMPEVPVTLPGADVADPFAAFASLPEVASLPAEADPRSAMTLLTPASLPAAATPESLPWLPASSGAVLSFFEEAQSVASVPAMPRAPSYDFHPDVVPTFNLTPQIFDAASIRRDFPILSERVHGRPLIWLDNAATTQKPQSVIDRISHFYEHENSNIHRAAHVLAARSTDAYEAAREKVRRFLNARSTREIVFVRGATEGINLVAQSLGRRYVEKDDEIVITWLEHHANIVPWQMLCAEKGARLRVAPVDDHGQVILEEYEKLLGPRTRLVSFAQVSNALGTVTPAREMVEMAHRHGAKVLVDGAQAVSHMRVDVQALDCDYYVFSGHKIFGPTGIGVFRARPTSSTRRLPGRAAAT